MSRSQQRSTARSSAILIGIVTLLVAAAVIGAVLLRRTGTTNSSNTNAATNTTSEQPVNIALGWPSFSSPYKVTVLLPRGMKPCLEADSSFSLRTGDCTSKDQPSFDFHRSDAWNGQDSVAVFNDAFAQELREAGLNSIAGQAAPITTATVTGLIYTFNDDLTAAVVTEREPVAGQTVRSMTITVNRKSVPTVDGVPQNVDAVLTAIIQGTHFSVPVVPTTENTNATP